MRSARALAAALALLTGGGSLCAADFSLAARAGFKTGHTGEYVYEGEDCISRLDWEDSFVPVLSLSGTLEAGSFLFRLSVAAAFPLRAGTMEDFDWHGGEPSHYSNHVSYLDKDFSWSVEAGRRFGWGRLALIPAAGFFWQSRAWQAADGTLYYPSGESSLRGTVLLYEQMLWFPYASLQAEYAVAAHFTLYAQAALYPYIWARALDSHFLRPLQFYDIMSTESLSGIGGSVGAGLLWRPGGEGGCAFSLSVRYERIGALSGPTASTAIGENAPPFGNSSGGGAKTESWNVQVFLGVTVPVSLRLPPPPE